MTRDPGITAGRRLSQAEREEQSRQRRAEVLALPMEPVRLRGYLQSPDGLVGLRGPAAAGVGFDGAAWAAWRAEAGDTGVLVTSHQGSRPATAQIQLPTSLRVRFVQPLPGGRVLIVAARTPPGQDNAEPGPATAARAQRADRGCGRACPDHRVRENLGGILRRGDRRQRT